MICIVGNMPVLQIGRHQITGYQTRWIKHSITQAAHDAGMEDFAFTDDVYQGIIHYLQNACPLRMLKIETLHERIRHMLRRIGYPSIAQALLPAAPPITISLERAARAAGKGFELAFYHELQQELNELRKSGASEVFFSNIQQGISILKQTDEWNDECIELEADILNWLHKSGTNPERQGYRIRANIRHLTSA